MTNRAQYVVSVALVATVATITAACAMFGKPTLTPEKICERVTLSESTVDVCASWADLQKLRSFVATKVAPDAG